jgi:peptide chain release factor 2
MKAVRAIKQWTDAFKEVDTAVEDLQVIFEYFEAGEVGEQELDQQFAETKELLEALETKNMLRKEEDRLSAVLKINAGAGGTESNDWADMLLRMYLRWAEKNGYSVRQASFVPGEDVGVKSVTLEIEGDFAYGYLKSENGVHRLVRISPFNAQGKRQTSFTSVFVTPLIDDTINIEINPGDITWDTFVPAGQGDKMSIKWKQAFV